ncbi:hypothetical protein [Pseudactinotalea sp. Z1748]|uniref:hypothetical protein n=1 Tax=Pseudactinotalea sp. Z1748 TaxID=3413027 RepID=UPI003C7E6F17
MSTHDVAWRSPARQPSGQPTGGQFAETSKPASGVNLSPPGQAPEGIQPWELMEAIRSGAVWDVETVAIRDNWGAKDWDEWEDAREQAELEEARAESVQYEGLTAGVHTSEIDGALVVQVDTEEGAKGRNIRIVVNDGDPVYDGNPEQDETVEQKVYGHSPAGPAHQLDKVMDEYHRMTMRMEQLSAQVVAGAVRAELPEARYVSLEESDQGDYWDGAAILDAERNVIGHWSDIDAENDDAIALSNLRPDASYEFIPPRSDDRKLLDLDLAGQYGRN